LANTVSESGSVLYGESLHHRLHELLRSTPWWAASLVVHVAILGFAYTYTWEIPLPKDEVKIDTAIRDRIELPPVMLELPKPVTPEQKITPQRLNEVRKVQLSQKNLPQLDDILKNQGKSNPAMAVLAAPGGVMRVGEIGTGEGFRVSGGLGTAIGDLTGWPGWQNRCLAVWLFDESKSMKDDQQVVRQKVDELYESLGIDLRDTRETRRIVTAVCGYGKEFHVLLKQPTTELDKVRRAIAHVPVDDTGKENYLNAINGVLNEFSRYARKYSRNIVIIMVTDEGGDDDKDWKDGKSDLLEVTVARMKRLKASLLVFGNEAGAFNHASEVTYDPTVAQGYSPWASVNRGIDTAFGEMFPFRWHLYYSCRNTQRIASGFGPYGPSRLCRETGGIYYLLRTASARTYDYEKLLGGYQPELVSRGEIAKRNGKNRARRVLMTLVDQWERIWEEGKRLEMYFRNDEGGRRLMERSARAADEWLHLANEAIREMDKLSNVAFEDSPKRWQANRELMWAQLHKIRFMMVQYRFAMMDLLAGRRIPPPGDIGWVVSRYYAGELRGDNMPRILEEQDKVRALYQAVIDHHAGTPWEAFAASEMRGLSGYAVRPYSRSRGGAGLKSESR